MEPNRYCSQSGQRTVGFAELKAAIRQTPSPQAPEAGSYKAACVFLLIYNPQNPHILAIQKTVSDGYPWSNQVALPGGHLDPADASALDAAFRELEEEVSIRRDQVQLLGSIGHFQTINRRDIEVFTGLWSGSGPVRYDPVEISRTLEIPLRDLVRTHIAKGYRNRIPDIHELRYPFEDVEVWGATARILHHFIELMYPILSKSPGRVSSD